jgi:hypothetical protein
LLVLTVQPRPCVAVAEEKVAPAPARASLTSTLPAWAGPTFVAVMM